MKNNFKPPKYRCKDCGAVIFSSYPGEFVRCNCPAPDYIFVDFTQHYGRMGGNPEKFEEVTQDAL